MNQPRPLGPRRDAADHGAMTNHRCIASSGCTGPVRIYWVFTTRQRTPLCERHAQEVRNEIEGLDEAERTALILR